MKSLYTFFQYAYLVVAVIFLYEAYSDYSNGGTRFYLYGLFAIVAVFMFFFKRKFNAKFDKNRKP